MFQKDSKPPRRARPTKPGMGMKEMLQLGAVSGVAHLIAELTLSLMGR